jgi:Uma2 family endonuclease
MSGGTEPRARLAARIIGLLGLHLQHCRIYDSNLKLYVEQFAKGVYPDAMAVCGEPKFWEGQRDVAVNPSLVMEVLSPSTENYDHGDKSSYYRSIPTIKSGP